MNMFMKFIERLLWVSGSLMLAFFLGYLGLAEMQRKNDVETFKDEQRSGELVEITPSERLQLAKYLPPVLESDEPPVIDYKLRPPDKSLWSAGRVSSFAASLGKDSSEILGVLEIPRLELEVPLYDGASDLNMDRGIARIEGTAMPDEAGNMGIAGHRDGYFRVLKDIKFGDEMILNSGAGEKRYRVQELMIVEPSAVDVLDHTEDTSITLVTCYPFYFVGHAPQRFIVRAVLQENHLVSGG
jgi:sortase A